MLHVSLPQPGPLLAQPLRTFAEANQEDVNRYVDRASRLSDVDSWNNYVTTGVAQERIEWEEEAYEALREELESLEEDGLLEDELADEQAEIEARLETARIAWEEDAADYILEERGRYRGRQAAIDAQEITEDEYAALIAAVEAEAAQDVNLDLTGWDALVDTNRAGLQQRFEDGLETALNTARAAVGGLSPEERAAFEEELDGRAAELRSEFDFRDHFYILRARNNYVARMRSDDVSARILADSESAESITEEVLAETRAELARSTEDMSASAEQQIDDLSVGEVADVGALDARAEDWEKQIESVIAAGLRRWNEAEERLYSERLAWQAEARRGRAEGEAIWKANHEKLEAAREEWLADVRAQIDEGRAQWEAKLAEFADSRETAEAELDRFITEERARRTASMDRLGELVRGGGGALLEAKDAYFYYDSLLAELQKPAADCSTNGDYDNQLYCFYLAQRNLTQNSINRFQRILADSEFALGDLMHSNRGDTGFLNDRRAYAGDLPERIAAFGVADFETNLRAEIDARSEDFVLYRRDIDRIIEGNAVFVRHTQLLLDSNGLDYGSASSVEDLQELVDGLDPKYDDHRAEINRIIAQDRGGLDDAAHLAAIQADIGVWLAASQNRDRRLRNTVLDYFNNGLNGYHLTSNENDPYLMTQAEYDWERLRRERNYLAKRLDTATAVKRYADLANKHEAGLEMAQITAERADITKVRRDVREIYYLLLKGDIPVDALAASDNAVRNSEYRRVLSERGIDPAYLNSREGLLNLELQLLDDLLAGRPTAGETQSFVERIDDFLVANVAEDARETHRLTATREKLLEFREDLQGGVAAATVENRWRSLAAGFTALRGELGALRDDYDFAGFRGELQQLRQSFADPTVVDRREEIYVLREQIQLNAEQLATARARLDLARADYSRARKDFQILKAGNSEELIRENLLETTQQLAGVLNQMSRIEDLPGFDPAGLYDAVSVQRAEYLRAVSGRRAADRNHARSSDLLKHVRGLEAAKTRKAALETLLAAANPPALAPDALADLFLNAEANLVARGAAEAEENSYDRAGQLMDALRLARTDFINVRDALDAAQSAGDPAEDIETLRTRLAQQREHIVELSELLIANIRGENEIRERIVRGLLDPDAALSPAAVVERSRAGADEWNERGLELSRDAAEDLADFLADHREESFAQLLELLNDAVAANERDLRLDLDDLNLAPPAGRAAMRLELARDWLLQNRALIEQANAAPDANDTRTVVEKWDALLNFAGGLQSDAAFFEQFQNSIPDSAGHVWVSDFRSQREALLSEIEGVLAAPNPAALAAAYAALSVVDRETLAIYGNRSQTTDRRAELESVRHQLSLELSALNRDYRAIYLREAGLENSRLVRSLSAELLSQGSQLEALRGESRELETEIDSLENQIAAEGDPGIRAGLEARRDAARDRVDDLAVRIAALEPIVANLERRNRRAANTLREIEQSGSTSPFFSAALQMLSAESEGLQMFGRLREIPRDPEVETTDQNTQSVTDQVKAIIGFYETNAAGEIVRDGAGRPAVSQEFRDRGITDPDAALETLLAGDQRGDDLQRWSDRLVRWMQDPENARASESEIVAAVTLLGDAIQEYQIALAYIENRDESSAVLRTTADADQERAQALLTKLGRFAAFEQALEEAAREAPVAPNGDPTGAMLAIFDAPANQALLQLFAGFDGQGVPDGVLDADFQERALELYRLAERLRETRRNQLLVGIAGDYADRMSAYVADPQAAADPATVTRIARVDFLNLYAELNASDVRTAIAAIPADERFRARVEQWLDTAPPRRRIYRDAVLGTLGGTPGSGAALRTAMLDRITELESEVNSSLAFYLDEIEYGANRDGLIRVDSTVTAAIAGLIPGDEFTADELVRLEGELYERELRRALYVATISDSYVADDYPEELREVVLLHQFDQARQRYNSYLEKHASDLQDERDGALLDLRGMGGDFARHILTRDFESYRALAVENTVQGFVDAARVDGDAVGLGDYVTRYLRDRNAVPGLLPEGGALLFERAAMHEYVRLYGDGNDAGGIHELDESRYAGDFSNYIRLAMLDDYVVANGISLSAPTEAGRRTEFRAHFEAALDSADYERDGDSLRVRLLSDANIEALFEDAFARIENGLDLDTFLPPALEARRLGGELNQPIPSIEEFLPAELLAIADYENADYRATAAAVDARYAAALAAIDSSAAIGPDEIRFGLELDDADLDAIIARAGYDGANQPDAATTLAIRTSLRAQISAAYFAGSGADSAERARQILREDRAIRSLLTDDALRQQAEVFLAGEGEKIATVEERLNLKIYSGNGPRSSALRQAAAEQPGVVLQTVIELSRGGQTAFYNGLDAAAQAELQTLSDELFGADPDAFSPEIQTALLARAGDFARALDIRATAGIAASGMIVELENQVASVIERGADDLRSAARGEENAILRALVESIYIARDAAPAHSAETIALFARVPGLEASLAGTAAALSPNFTGVVVRDRALVTRFLDSIQESAAERAHIEAIFAEPSLIDPSARFDLRYASQTGARLLQNDRERQGAALLAVVNGKRSLRSERGLRWSRELATAKALKEFAGLRGDQPDLNRFSNYRTYVGSERSYQEADYQEYQDGGPNPVDSFDRFHEGLVLESDSLNLDPRTLFDGADWQANLLSDDPARIARSVDIDDQAGDDVHIVTVRSVSTEVDRIAAGDSTAQFDYIYHENLANNYLEAVSRLNAAFVGVFQSAAVAGGRGEEHSQTNFRQLVEADYNVDAAAGVNDLTALEEYVQNAADQQNQFNDQVLQEGRKAIAGVLGHFAAAEQEFADGARRKHLARLGQTQYIEEQYRPIAAAMEQAENEVNTLSLAGDGLQIDFEAANIRYVADLNTLADRFQGFSAANDEYERRQAVREFAETPYLLAAVNPDTAQPEALADDGFSADAREEYRLALEALNAAQERLDQAGFALQSEPVLGDLQTIIAGLDNGESYAPLSDAERDQLFDLRDRKFNQHATLTAAEEDLLAALHLRETHEVYGDVLVTRGEHIRHSLRMIRVRKAREILSAEIEQRRAIAEERKQAFENELNTRFGINSSEDADIKNRNAVYLRLAGMVENGRTNFYNEFRGWYGITPQREIEGEPGKQRSPRGELNAARLVGAAINAADQAAIQGFVAAGGYLSEFSAFGSVFRSWLHKLGERDMALDSFIVTTAVFTPVLYAGIRHLIDGISFLASWFLSFLGPPLIILGSSMIYAATSQIYTKFSDYDGKRKDAAVLRRNAESVSGTESVRKVRNKQELYEEALADLEYFTKSPDLQTSKERIIQWGRQHTDAKAIGSDAAGPNLYRITDEDLLYLFDNAENGSGGERRFVNSTGGDLTLTAGELSEALDVGGLREGVQFRDAFGRRYNPSRMESAEPGPLQAGTYRANGLEYIRIKFTQHNGTWQYRYAPLIADDAPDEQVFDLGKILNLTADHGQGLRDLRRDRYLAAGEAVAGGAGDPTLVLKDRDAAFAGLFADAGDRRSGGREFSGYRTVYEEYEQNQREVLERELVQRRDLQLREWELREQELNDRYALWERKTQTLLAAGTGAWGTSRDSYLQKWREWERQYDQKIEQGREAWEAQTREHFTARDAWEVDIRGRAAEKSAEIVLNESIQDLNTQIRRVENSLQMDFEDIHAISAINEVIDDIRRTQPGKTEQLRNINAGIADFNTRLALSDVNGANIGAIVAPVSGRFREQSRIHQKQMRTLANVKVFEQYRRMIQMFSEQLDVQNEQIENQTRAAALGAGFQEEGDLFVKTTGTSGARGIVNRYKWFDTQGAINRELDAIGFTKLDGNELFAFLENKSNFEVDSYFQTQRLATQTVFQKIVGTAPGERNKSRDPAVIGLFGAWVGATKVEVDVSKYQVDPADYKQFEEEIRIFRTVKRVNPRLKKAQAAADARLAAAQAGYGELGSGGVRPGGAPLGFYPQLQKVSEDLAKKDQEHLASLGGPVALQAIAGIVNGFNPAMWIASAAQNVGIATISGTKFGSALWANILNVVKQAATAVGSALAAMTGVGLAATIAGMAMIVAGNMIQVNPQTGETGFGMTDQAALSSMLSIMGAGLGPVTQSLGGTSGALASLTSKLSTSVVRSGLQYDEDGNLQGFSGRSALFGGLTTLASDVAGKGFGGEAPGANASFGDHLSHGIFNQGVSNAAATTVEYLKYEFGGAWGRENSHINMMGGDLASLGGIIGGAAGDMASRRYAAYRAKQALAEQNNKAGQKNQAKEILDGSGYMTQRRRKDWMDVLADTGPAQRLRNWWNDEGFNTNDQIREGYSQLMASAKDEQTRKEIARRMVTTGMFTAAEINSLAEASALSHTRMDATEATYHLRAAAGQIKGRIRTTAQGQAEYAALKRDIEGASDGKVSLAEMHMIAKKHGIPVELLFSEKTGNAAARLQGNDINRAAMGKVIGQSLGAVTRNARAAGMSVQNYVKKVYAEQQARKAAIEPTRPGERLLVKDTLLGKSGALGWLDNKLGTNLTGYAARAYNHDNFASNLIRERDVAERVVVKNFERAYDTVKNQDWKRIGLNTARIAGGALQAYGGAALVGLGGAGTATGVGAVPGVLAVAAGSFMVANGAADVAMGVADLYRMFDDPNSRMLEGNLTELSRAVLGKDSAVTKYAAYADITAGMVGGIGGMVRGAARMSVNVARGVAKVGAVTSRATVNVARGVVNTARVTAQTVGRGYQAVRTAAVSMGRSALSRAGQMVDRGWQGVRDVFGRGGAYRQALFSSDELSGVERASQSLIDSVSSKRVVTWAEEGTDALNYLNFRNAEAVSLGLDDIILRPNPSKAAVLEEFLHGTQHRLGIVDRLGTSGLGSAETHVKDFMIRHRRLLGIGAEDIRRLQILRDMGL